MLSDYFGCFMSPGQLAKHETWFTKDGLILWDKLSFSRMAFDGRRQGRNDAEIRAALKDPKRAVILQVDNGQHWVAALKKTLWGNSYVCLDPWTGKKCDVIKSYRNITGYSLFKTI